MKITVTVNMLEDGRFIFMPANEPSHTFNDWTAARYFAMGFTYGKLMQHQQGAIVEVVLDRKRIVT